MTIPNLIQETNIENILEENLWQEIHLLEKRRRELGTQIDALQERENKLRNIAVAAELEEPG